MLYRGLDKKCEGYFHPGLVFELLFEQFYYTSLRCSVGFYCSYISEQDDVDLWCEPRTLRDER